MNYKIVSSSTEGGLMSKFDKAILKPTMIEICSKGKYQWVGGYTVITPEGNEVQPYMRCNEAKQYCRDNNWNYEVIK